MTIAPLNFSNINITKFTYNPIPADTLFMPLFNNSGYTTVTSSVTSLPYVSTTLSFGNYVPSLPALPRINVSNILSNIKTRTNKIYNSVKKSVSSAVSSTGNKIVNIAKKFIGYNEKDGSYLRFTNGRREAWCADFVSYVCKQAGISGPNTTSVEGIRQWGKARGKYSNTAKVGSAVIFKNGTSHTGIVESISDGKITCIEGNTSDKVARRTYSINDSRISGFVQLA